jgi:UDP-glucose 4-epimerase
MGRPARLLSIPPAWLHAVTRLLGRPGIYQRLCGSLRVDAGLARQLLGWTPPQSVNEGLRYTVEHYLQKANRQADAGERRA